MRTKVYENPQLTDDQIKARGGVDCPRCKRLFPCEKDDFGYKIGWACPPCQSEQMHIRELAAARGRAWRKRQSEDRAAQRARWASYAREYRARKADATTVLRASADALLERLAWLQDAPWDAPGS